MKYGTTVKKKSLCATKQYDDFHRCKKRNEIYRVHIVWFHLNKVQEQTKLIYSNKIQKSSCL